MKNKIYLITYYFCFLITMILLLIMNKNEYIIGDDIYYIIGYINVFLVIIFSILQVKKKFNFNSIIFPISYIIFYIMIVIICLIFNNKVLIPSMHYHYYLKFLLGDYLLLNIYTILNIDLKKRKNS